MQVEREGWRGELGRALVIVACLAGAGVILGRVLERGEGSDIRSWTDGVRTFDRPGVLRQARWDRARPLELRGARDLNPERVAFAADGHTAVFAALGPEGDLDLFVADVEGERLVDPRAIYELNSDGDDFAPAFAAGRILFSSDRSGGAGGLDLYEASYRAARSLEDASFGDPVALEGLNGPDDERDPAPFATGGGLVFASDRGRGRAGETDLFLAHRSADPGAGLGWDVRELSGLNSLAREVEPVISRDGRHIYFASDRAGGAGEYDLYRSALHLGDWLAPEPVHELNTPVSERGPALDVEGFVLFFTRGAALDEERDRTPRLFRARSVELFPMRDPGLGLLDLFFLITLLLIALLAYLARRWDTLEVIYKCLIVSLIIHLLLLAWSRRLHPESEPKELPRREALFQVRLASDVAQRREDRRREHGGVVEASSREVKATESDNPERADSAASNSAALAAAEVAVESGAALELTTLRSDAANAPSARSGENVVPGGSGGEERAARSQLAGREARAAEDLESGAEESSPTARALVVSAERESGSGGPGRRSASGVNELSEAGADRPSASGTGAQSSSLALREVQHESPGGHEMRGGPASFAKRSEESTIDARRLDARGATATRGLASGSQTGGEAAGTFADEPAPTARAGLGGTRRPGPSAGPVAMSPSAGASASRNKLDTGATGPPRASLAELAGSSAVSAPAARGEAARPKRLELGSSEGLAFDDAVQEKASAGTTDSLSSALAGEIGDALPQARETGASRSSRTAPSGPSRLASSHTPSTSIGASATADSGHTGPVREQLALAPVRGDSGRGESGQPGAGRRDNDRESAVDAGGLARTPYRSRFGREKLEALEEHGGGEETERAVALGLAYLASVQKSAGYWGRSDLQDRKYGYVAIGKSGLCLLAFLGAGHTPSSATRYSNEVARVVEFLLATQDDESGHFGYSSSYGHGIATYALAECFALTRDEGLRAPLERAVAHIISEQTRSGGKSRRGGWTYYYPDGRRDDGWPRASITAWQVMALESARLGGLEVPDESFSLARRFLRGCLDRERGVFRYSHDPDRLNSDYPILPGSTPASIFVLSLMGEDFSDRRYGDALSFLAECAPRRYRYAGDEAFIERAEGNLYFWYYGTLASFRLGGARWDAWNAALKTCLLPAQAADGSFEPISIYARDYARDDGEDRSYSTAMCVLSLEIYYRYFTPLLKVD